MVNKYLFEGEEGDYNRVVMNKVCIGLNLNEIQRYVDFTWFFV